ncbi:MAG: HEAT repeat domain-containing protein [Bacteroidales bacterium]
MNYRIISILALLLFTMAYPGPEPETGPLYRTPYPVPAAPAPLTAAPSPIYFNDAIRLFTAEPDSVKIDNLISRSGDFYPIQIGAFRVKANADRMYEKITEVLGNDVIMVEEAGLFKVRVTKLNKDKIAGYIESRSESASDGSEIRVRVPLQDKLKAEIPASDSAKVRDTIPVTSIVADTAVFAALASDLNVVEPAEIKKLPRFFLLNGDSPWLKRINYFGKSFALVNALIITIMISIATMIILLGVILLNRARMEKEENLKQYLAETYQSMIIDYLFSDTRPDQFRRIASDTYRRQALIDQMIDVSINLKGDAEEKLCGLYLYLGLDRDSIKRANDFRWHKKIKGFRELAFMNIKDANDAVYKALNSSNEILRMEAQIALVRLTDEDPFGFLFHLKRPFSLWEQITLHELIIQHDLPVPEFKKWLRATNPSVVMFALRMIKEFRQKNAEDEVRDTLDHPSPEVRRLAVQVAGDLEMRSTLESMKRMYKSQDYNTCIEIIRAMAKMPDVALMGFLRLVLDKEDDVQLQIEATKAIENNGEEGVRTLVKLMKSEYKNYNIIVRHVLDRRIF